MYFMSRKRDIMFITSSNPTFIATKSFKVMTETKHSTIALCTPLERSYSGRLRGGRRRTGQLRRRKRGEGEEKEVGTAAAATSPWWGQREGAGVCSDLGNHQ